MRINQGRTDTRFGMPILILLMFIGLSGNSSVGISMTPNDQDPYVYHSYQDMTDELSQLAVDYPEIMHLQSLGASYEGRLIWLVELTSAAHNNSDKSEVLLMGAHHGNEKPSYEILIYFINHMINFSQRPNTDDDGDGSVNEDIIDGFDNDQDGLVDEDPSEERVRQLLNTTRFFVMPMVNPDGVEADSRKNRAPNYGPFGTSSEITSYGVDLNRNYGFQWFLYYLMPFSYHLLYITRDNGFNYRGEHPFSENETQAVRSFVEQHDIALSLSYHSYGQFVLFPWTHTSLKTPDEQIFLSVGENITRINQYYLYRGRNFVVPRFTGTIGTSENWLYGEQDILSFTVELCAERAPTDPLVVEEVCRTHVGVNLYVAERSEQVESERESLHDHSLLNLIK